MGSTNSPGLLFGSTPEREAQREAQAAATRAEFPQGAFVRLLPGQAESYQAAEAAKLKDRVGIVRSHQVFSGSPIVDFPAFGRRKHHSKSFSHPKSYIEVVTDPAEIEQWRTAFAAAEAKAAAKKPTPKPVNKS
jgi:hypothetical protein